MNIEIPDYNFSMNDAEPPTLAKAIKNRRSIRSFSNKPLSIDVVKQLAWATQGINSSKGYRTCPSAGATYPLELYVAHTSGVYHYLPEKNELNKKSNSDIRKELAIASLGQMSIAQAPAVFVFTAVMERTARRYGDRAERYVNIEVGHCAQNLALAVAGMNLASYPVGAFSDNKVKDILSAPTTHEPLYIVPVGYPSE